MWILWGQELGLQQAVTELFLNALGPGHLGLTCWGVGQERGGHLPAKTCGLGEGCPRGVMSQDMSPHRDPSALPPMARVCS